jgi:hypothetical protein
LSLSAMIHSNIHIQSVIIEYASSKSTAPELHQFLM